jgi:uncharacterized protein (DUF934 family)
MKFINTSKDPWHTLGGEDGPAACINPAPHLLLNLAQWRAFRARWPDAMPVGVALSNDTEVRELVPDLARLSLIALSFPKWVDGRAYSQAHTLRARHRYAGEVRATGDVLVDMVPLLARTGFDSARLRADQSLDDARHALTFFAGHYQGGLDDPLPLFAKPAGASDVLARSGRAEFTAAGEAI